MLRSKTEDIKGHCHTIFCCQFACLRPSYQSKPPRRHNHTELRFMKDTIMFETNQRRRRRRDEYCSAAPATARSESSNRKSCARFYHIGLVMCCWWFGFAESFLHHVVSNADIILTRSCPRSLDRHHQNTFHRCDSTRKIRRKVQSRCSSQYLSTVKGGPNPCYRSSSLSVATSASTGEGIQTTRFTREELQTLTVKELRQIVKDSPHNERGILTKLKLKKDLINFLDEIYSNEGPTKHNGHVVTETTPKTKPSTPMGMPSPTRVKIANSKKSATSMLQQQEDLKADDDSSAVKNTSMSPKDTLFDRVYERYPPILTENCTGLGDFDVRQQYHPMLRQFHNTSSDMDLVFVGTASCTPGVSRGVSCTALRLNWKRRSFQFAPDIPPMSSSSPSTATTKSSRNGQQQQDDHMIDLATSFSGGTWLFDCGECTQVRRHKQRFHLCPLLYIYVVLVGWFHLQMRKQ